MSDAKKAEKILPEELQYLETLKKENTIYVLRSENTKLQYENALFKIMRKYQLSETDSIDESNGAIVRRSPPPPPVMQAPPPPQPPPPAPPPAPPVEQAARVETVQEVSSTDKPRSRKNSG